MPTRKQAKVAPTLPPPNDEPPPASTKCRAEVPSETAPSPTFGGGGPEGRRGSEAAPRPPAFAIAYVEAALDRIYAHLLAAEQPDELMRLARALSVCTTALFNAHRISAVLNGEAGVMEEALRELGELEFDED